MRALSIAVLAILAASTVAGFPRLHRMNIPAQRSDVGDNKAACLGNITAALGDLNQAKVQIEDSITDCEAAVNKTGTWEKCAEHVSDIASELADTAINIAEAVPACGGPGSLCADQIIAIAHELTKTSDDVFHAITDCTTSGDKTKCTFRIVMIAEEIGQMVGTIEGAVKDCKKSNTTSQVVRRSDRRVKKGALRAGSSAACLGNVTAALGALNGAKDQLGDSITDCKAAVAGNATWEQCAEHVSDIASDLADAAKDIALAVPACGGYGSLCADEIVSIAHELTKTSDDVFHAITDCTTTGDKSKCTLRIVMIAEEVESLVKSIEGAVQDCKKQ